MTHTKIRPHRVNGVFVDQVMLMPDETAVAAAISAVPAGTVSDLGRLRASLAAQYGADATCPVTTQRMIKIVAARSVVDHAAGRKAVPFWRVTDPDRPNSARLPGGSAFIRARRKEEG